MKIPKLYYAFGIFGSAIIIVAYVKWNGLQPILETTERATVALEKQLHSEQSRIGQEVLYGIMFDAGSTGTRIHVFKFTQNPKETPKVIDETFRGLRPGLSAYADNVDESAQGINELLAVAKEVIPMELWKSTPLVLKATAGLRLLPGEKAQQLLDKVKEIFHASPFLVNDDCISIMEGTDEGISAWVTVNFLTGRFTDPTKGTVGILDLGGGSTQITFHAASGQSSASDIISFKMFNHVYQLYSHSYLGLGLRMARLAVLGAIQGQALKEGEELTSPCSSPDFQGEWEHAKILYKIKGQKAGKPVYESCLNKVAKILKRKVHKKPEVKDIEFYPFSYYYDLATNFGLIDKEEGGTLTVSDFETAANNACGNMEAHQEQHPFLCMDLTYISLLLQKLGFPKSHNLKLVRKINNIEIGWALGATLRYMDSLSKLQY
ncbi:ectonucleoside triphosphate diphosphohydrolase 6 isoform X2 [Sphaerodactylus townsendi]|uniref:ectonucleoside triphosphate diphosphohydrolase 6 isoform X2 n=1 Tax=Sphaerodactylus townsendi TaxID=933632 RepID=UPI0020274D09|nr:ectonucleoside triphosphate diphosphohydrolase 6 isoform X2 [Sphaerodactylus townsendi]